MAMDVASFGSTEGRGHRWPASHRRVDGATIKQDDCNDRDVSRMCRRAFAPPHAAYRARKRARESHLCKSTLLGTVIATFFRVPTHSRRASRHSIGVKARHRWGLCLYRFHPLCTAKIQNFGGCNQVGAQGAQLDDRYPDLLPIQRHQKRARPAKRGHQPTRRPSHRVGRGREKVRSFEFETLWPATNRRCARRTCAAGEPSCVCSRRVSRGPVRLRARG